MLIIKILFHAGVIIPIFAGHYYAAAAYALVVAVFYIKAMKYQAQLDALASRVGTGSRTYQEILKVRNRFRSLTFLK
jgi:hypothetical protein